MQRSVQPWNETDRVADLIGSGVLGTDPIDGLRDVLAALSHEFGMASAVSVIGRYYQHFKASVGVAIKFIPRDHSFCTYTILQDEPLIVPDLTRDSRFLSNLFVTDAPYLRFYAGVPLRTMSCQRLGALCLLDTEPRTLSASERDSLLHAASTITQLLHRQEATGQITALRRAIASGMQQGDGRRIAILSEQLYRALSQQSYSGVAA